MTEARRHAQTRANRGISRGSGRGRRESPGHARHPRQHRAMHHARQSLAEGSMRPAKWTPVGIATCSLLVCSTFRSWQNAQGRRSEAQTHVTCADKQTSGPQHLSAMGRRGCILAYGFRVLNVAALASAHAVIPPRLFSLSSEPLTCCAQRQSGEWKWTRRKAGEVWGGGKVRERV